MQKRHQPYHLYLDDQIYFVTAHTYLDRPYLDTASKKMKLLGKIKEFLKAFHFNLYAWVILDNHYHILFKVSRGKDLPKTMNKIHCGYSYERNKIENQKGRKIWQNYWDRCIRSEKDFWRHFNYIHHNPVKHGYVQKMEEYEFSSYNYWIKKRGEEWIMSAFREHPIRDFTVPQDA
jgi:putative transposase